MPWTECVVLEGLKGAIAEAGGNLDVDYDRLISQLGSRVFLLHNVHEDGPVVFHTRWVMSYLRGPLTRPQVRQLMADRKHMMPQASTPNSSRPAMAPTVAATSPAVAPTTEVSGAPDGFSPTPPSLSQAIELVYLPIELSERVAVRQLVEDEGNTVEPESIVLTYEPAIVGAASVRYYSRKHNVDQQAEQLLLTRAPNGPLGVDWEDAETLSIDLRDLLYDYEYVDEDQGPYFAPVPEKANSVRLYFLVKA